jgi:hypothetical protein
MVEHRPALLAFLVAVAAVVPVVRMELGRMVVGTNPTVIMPALVAVALTVARQEVVVRRIPMARRAAFRALMALLAATLVPAGAMEGTARTARVAVVALVITQLLPGMAVLALMAIGGHRPLTEQRRALVAAGAVLVIVMR